MKGNRITLQDIHNQRIELEKEIKRIERTLNQNIEMMVSPPTKNQSKLESMIYKGQRFAQAADMIWAGYKLMKKIKKYPIFKRK